MTDPAGTVMLLAVQTVPTVSCAVVIAVDLLGVSDTFTADVRTEVERRTGMPGANHPTDQDTGGAYRF